MPWFNVANVGMLTGDLQILVGNGGRNDWIHRTLPASAVKSLRRLTPPPPMDQSFVGKNLLKSAISRGAHLWQP